MDSGTAGLQVEDAILRGTLASEEDFSASAFLVRGIGAAFGSSIRSAGFIGSAGFSSMANLARAVVLGLSPGRIVGDLTSGYGSARVADLRRASFGMLRMIEVGSDCRKRRWV